MLENLFSRDDIIPKDFSPENEEEYFKLLQAKEIGKVITNISEYLLETEGMQGKSKVRLHIDLKQFIIESCILVQTWLKVF